MAVPEPFSNGPAAFGQVMPVLVMVSSSSPAAKRAGNPLATLAPSYRLLEWSVPERIADDRSEVSAAADLLAARLAEQGVSGCDLVGHADGASVVIELAIRRPDLVRRVVLSSPRSGELGRLIEQVTVPVGFVCGSADAVVPMRHVYENAGGRRVLVIPGAGDEAHVAQPQTFAAAVLRLLVGPNGIYRSSDPESSVVPFASRADRRSGSAA